jgi:putative membrane protein
MPPRIVAGAIAGADRLPPVGAESPWVSDQEAAAIRAAVEEAERSSAAEIVPVLLEAADPYAVADWKGAALGALLASAGAALLERLDPSWGPSAIWILLPAFAGAAAAALAARAIPALRRVLAGRDLIDDRVESRAREAFLEHEVFRTRDRSGVLVLVALFEHRVRILADTGIHAAVPHERWQQIADATARAVREGRPGEALRQAVVACGAVLGERGPRRRADDVNELPDAPVTERT